MEKVVILAAGLGSRLKPLTVEVPKCLTEINGEPVLLHSLKILEKNGIKECLIVVGYLGEVIIKTIGDHFGSMKISYAWNYDFENNNSMYSAWIGRKFLEQGSFLIEGDCLFDESLIKKALSFDEDKSCWVLDKFTPNHDGSMSIIDKNNRIISIIIVREKLPVYLPNYYKSTGILKITSEYGQKYSQWLDEEVKANNVKVYHDLVLAKHLQDEPIYACNITGERWFEIDDFEDVKKAERTFNSMKYVIVLMDGATDHPVLELGGKTPLDVANIPNIHYLAKEGKTGYVRTMHPGLPVESIVANLGILGYNPARYYPQGRASFEAMAKDIFLQENDVAFRCNLISLDENGNIKDFTANQITDENARKIVSNLKFNNQKIELFPGQSYRNTLVVRNVGFDVKKLTAHKPHENIGKNYKDLLMSYSGPANSEVEELNQIMLNSQEQIKELNRINPTDAHMIWLWSPSFAPNLPSFSRKFGIEGAVVAGLDFMRGIAQAAKMESREIPGANGYLDSNFSEKLRYAKHFLRNNDLVYIHINAPDEEGHARSPKRKIEAIEKIDKEIVGPLYRHLTEKYGSNFRIAILSDHHTLVENGQHSDEPVPYLMYGYGFSSDSAERFTETEISTKSSIKIRSDEFMNVFIGNEK